MIHYILQFSLQGHSLGISSVTSMELQGQCSQLTEVVPKWMEQIEESYVGDSEVGKLITEAAIDKQGPQEYCLQQGLLQYRGKWVLGSTGNLRKQNFE